MPELIARLQALEAEICYLDPPPDGRPEFTYLAGRVPVLLSAPHGAAHTRNGRLKNPDEFTAGFARLVAERTGAHVLYTHHRSPTDPNFYRHAPYKTCLSRLARTVEIQFVFDIHGASPRRNFGIALGTMYGRACSPGLRNLIIRTLAAYGFKAAGPNLHRLDRLDVDDAFPGGVRQHTVTRFVSQNLNIPAAQIELNAYLRTFQPAPDARGRAFTGDWQRIHRTVDAFVALVGVIAAAPAAV